MDTQNTAANGIPAFEKDHDAMSPGFYRSSDQSDVAVFDMRMVKPNQGRFLPQPVIHSLEHMVAAALRNGKRGAHIVYFGPMGCRTGFYLLTRGLSDAEARDALLCAMRSALNYNEVPGASRKSCGNYLEHNIASAKRYLKKYFELLLAEDKAQKR